MSRGGPRPNAGRKLGSRNKAVIERELLAEQVAARANMNGERLGKEVLAEFMTWFRDLAERVKPKYGPNGEVISGDEREFERWARRALQCAKDLAPYQSPQYRAIAVAASPQASNARQVVTRKGFASRDSAESMRTYLAIMHDEIDLV